MRYRRDSRRGMRRVAVALAAPLGVVWLCGLTMGAGESGGTGRGRARVAAGAAFVQGQPAAAAASAVAAPRPSGDGRPAIEWLRFHDPGERVTIGAGGIAMGPLGSARRLYPFLRNERAADVGFFAGTYSPFRARTPDGELVFLGRGPVQPGAVERRMILEWARLATLEAEGGPSASEVGLALAWHRGATTGGICDDLAVYLTGEVRAGSCLTGGEVRGRLDRERLERLYRWFDSLKPFQSQAEQGERANLLLERLVFAGRGAAASTPRDASAMEAFASALYHQVTTAPVATATVASATGSALPAGAGVPEPAARRAGAGPDAPSVGPVVHTRRAKPVAVAAADVDAVVDALKQEDGRASSASSTDAAEGASPSPPAAPAPPPR